MAQEVEITLRVGNADELRGRLRTAGAIRVAHEIESNSILDTDGGVLRCGGCGLRVRIAAPLLGDGPPRAILTFKGPRVDAAGTGTPPGQDPRTVTSAIRMREEIETEIADAANLLLILGRLGYQPRVMYEKRRETWSLDGAEIALDELPRLGWFAEIEAASPGAVEEFRQRLGFAAQSVVAETYPELTRRHGTERNGALVLRFSDTNPPTE